MKVDAELNAIVGEEAVKSARRTLAALIDMGDALRESDRDE